MATKVTRKSTKPAALSRSRAKVSSSHSTSSRKVEFEEMVMPESHETSSTSQRAKAGFRRSSLLVIGVIIIIAGLVFLSKSAFIVAMVNGQPITRAQYYAELESQSGKQVLNTIVTKKLIEEEAAKRHVTVSDNDVNGQIKTISDNLAKQGRKLDDALAIQGLTMSQLKDQLKYQIMIQKMVGNSITVSDKEVNDYIDKNKDSLPQNQDPEQLKKMVADQLKQQKLSEATQSWIANLQKTGHVDYFIPQ